ncbi:PulJ/GspJ family protein [Litoreibacter roseus]|uniref:Prepilin-type N-terminal cleavage/methylation domain-containing protein n=1 Tax=Litoreibacter roseus TaxID=2601869 RepID=A0A6N6JJH2_9RHOB|nr:prepilin-type N-terminal cleavage/methylation domain-containing protein [Litoreibacter roseus]GFE66493.1 hypothetical protein KIN_35670 [Litoreibacter roseus]
MRHRRHHRGFTLIETLVSLGIATLAVTGFYQSLSTGALMDQRATSQADRMLVATQVMDRVGVDVPVRPGFNETGVAGDWDWSLTISDVAARDMQLGPIQRDELVYVYVTVTAAGTDNDPLTLRGIRYAQAPL